MFETMQSLNSGAMEKNLGYAGVNEHKDVPVGDWSTVLAPDDYKALYAQQADLDSGM